MKHLVVVIAILGTLGFAHGQGQPSGNCLELKKVKIADHVVHQWGDTRAELTFKAKNCRVIDTPERATVTWETQPGLAVQVSSIGLEDIDQQSAHHPPFQAGEMTITVNLEAWRDLAVGEHELRGIVTYQAISSSGVIATESLPISLHFEVAPPKPPKGKNEFVEGLKTTGEVVAGIALLPVFLVVMLVYCPISGECPDC